MAPDGLDRNAHQAPTFLRLLARVLAMGGEANGRSLMP